MSTIWAGSDGRHDDLGTPADLDAWLDAVGLDRRGARAGPEDLADARDLRDAVRFLAGRLTADHRAAAGAPVPDVDAALAWVNRVVAALPAPRIALRAGELVATTTDGDAPVTDALATVAAECISMLTGPASAKLLACDAPGCVLYFVKTHPRREWCSVACGNRARAARHYQRVRQRR